MPSLIWFNYTKQKRQRNNRSSTRPRWFDCLLRNRSFDDFYFKCNQLCSMHSEAAGIFQPRSRIIRSLYRPPSSPKAILRAERKPARNTEASKMSVVPKNRCGRCASFSIAESGLQPVVCPFQYSHDLCIMKTRKHENTKKIKSFVFSCFRDEVSKHHHARFTYTVLTSVYSSRAYSPSSRPKPLILKPPNGAAASKTS
jgi:hypothetical protein